MKDMENIGSSVRRAVVDQIFSRRKAFYPGSNLLRRPARVRMLGKQPETVHDAVYQPLSRLRTRAPRPININLVEVLLRLPCDSIAHRRFGNVGIVPCLLQVCVCRVPALRLGASLGKSLPPPRLHPVRQLLQSLASFIFRVLARIDCLNADPHALPDALDLLLR
jgi:hypothetical protein